MLPFGDDSAIRLSRFAHVIHLPQLDVCVHSLTSTPVFYDQHLAECVSQLSGSTTWGSLKENMTESAASEAEDLLAKMVEAKLIVPADYDELTYLESVRKTVLCGPHFDVLFMLLTDACNLDCTYCFINGGKVEGYKESHMTVETARASVDAFARWKAPEGDKSVVFYGGEPLLNKAAFVATLEHLQQKVDEGVFAPKTDRILITNGTLLDEELVQVIVKHGVFPYLSIDGPPELHNRQRPFRSGGGGSFNVAVAGLRMLREVGIEPGISITVTDEMLKDLPETLKWLAVNLEIKAVGFNMLESIPGRKYFADDYGERFADALLRCQEVCDEYGIYEERVMRKAKQFVKREVYVFDCAACGEQLTIAPDGQVGVCQGFVGTREFFSGNVNDPNYDPRVDPVFIEWSAVSPLAHDTCFDCPALGLCGGGCPRNPYLQGKGIHGVDERFCTHVLKTQEWILDRMCQRLYDE